MKKILLALTIVSIISLIGCGPQGNVTINPPNDNVSVTPATDSTSMGLDLQALGEMVRKSQNAQDIEQKLNQPNSINNLDLDKDGKTDYISVKEYDTLGVRGFSFIANLNDGSKQEVCTVEIKPPVTSGGQANMNINGNQTIYGNNTNYASSYSLADLMFYSYLFSSTWHPYYSPYHWGYYPSYYSPYNHYYYHSYYNRMAPYRSSTRITKTTNIYISHSPNTKTATSNSYNRQRSISSNKSQKSYSSRSNTSSYNNHSSSSRSSSRNYSGSHSSGGRHR